jgi:hypothetical protein
MEQERMAHDYCKMHQEEAPVIYFCHEYSNLNELKSISSTVGSKKPLCCVCHSLSEYDVLRVENKVFQTPLNARVMTI